MLSYWKRQRVKELEIVGTRRRDEETRARVEASHSHLSLHTHTRGGYGLRLGLLMQLSVSKVNSLNCGWHQSTRSVTFFFLSFPFPSFLFWCAPPSLSHLILRYLMCSIQLHIEWAPCISLRLSASLIPSRAGGRADERASGGGSQHSVYVGYQKGKGKKLNPSCAKVILSYRDGSHRTAIAQPTSSIAHTQTHTVLTAQSYQYPPPTVCFWSPLSCRLSLTDRQAGS